MHVNIFCLDCLKVEMDVDCSDFDSPTPLDLNGFIIFRDSNLLYVDAVIVYPDGISVCVDRTAHLISIVKSCFEDSFWFVRVYAHHFWS